MREEGVRNRGRRRKQDRGREQVKWEEKGKGQGTRAWREGGKELVAKQE